MINNITLVGRLTTKPELRQTQTGKSVTNFTIAANRNYKGNDQVDFINCVAWNHSAEFMAKYLSKGSLVGLVGRLQSGSYQDEYGKTIYTQEVVAEQVQALESKRTRLNNQSDSDKTNEQINRQDDHEIDMKSDDLPF